jgi:guanylate kinase
MLIVVSAPSGTGKTSLCRKVLAMFPELRFSVSWTTRPPRPGEREGQDYRFTSEAEFRRRIAQGEFVEWVENYGHLYGTSIRTVESFLDQGHDLLLDVDPRGARAIKERFPSGVFVFLLPPSIAALEIRLSRRGESTDVMATRLAKAKDEIREMIWYDYLIVNDRLDEAVDRLRAVYVAETCRRERVRDRMRGDLQSLTG